MPYVFRRKNIGIVGQKTFGVYLSAASTAPADHRNSTSNAATIPVSISDFQGLDLTHFLSDIVFYFLH